MTLNQLVETNPMMSVADLAEATGIKAYTVREMFKRFGWHVAKGGSVGHSPWHKDDGKPCLFGAKKAPRGVDLDAPAGLKRGA